MSKLKIRYYAHVGKTTGYGIAASDLCLALSRHPGVDLQIVPLQKEVAVAGRFLPLASLLRSRGGADLEPNPDVVIVHTLPTDCRRVLELEKLSRSKDRILVAQTTWEAMGQAPVIEELLCFDQIWSPSHASLASFYDAPSEAAGTLPARRLIPHCFDEVPWAQRHANGSSQLRDEGKFCFYYIGADSGRKNISGLLRAWALAFSDADQDVVLRVVAPGGLAARAATIAQTGLKVTELAPIEWRSRVSDAEIEDLHWNSGDCFVTASRGEAWNLPAFDAMLAGRHVISPGRLGSDDFLRETTADLYRAWTAPAFVDVVVTPPAPTDPPGGVRLQVVGAQGINSRCLWLDPDLKDLAGCMNTVRQSRQRSLNVKYNPMERYGYQAVANLVVDTLTEGHDTRPWRGFTNERT